MLQIKQSPIHGVGVFATEDIPKDTVIQGGKMVRVGNTSDFLNGLPTVGVVDSVGDVYVPIEGFAILWALNYGIEDNVAANQHEIFTTRDVKAGEELLVMEYK
jgi:hypothetical protein